MIGFIRSVERKESIVKPTGAVLSITIVLDPSLLVFPAGSVCVAFSTTVPSVGSVSVD